MQRTAKFAALFLSAVLAVPGFALADPTLQQQVKMLQNQMQSLVKENARERSRITSLERRLAQHPAKRSESAAAAVAAAPASAKYAKNYGTPVSVTPVTTALASYNASQLNGQSYPAPATYASTTSASAASASNSQYDAQGATQSPQATYGSPAPASAAVNSVYQQENAVFNKGLTLTESATYTYGDNRLWTLNGFMALGAIFLGNLNVSEQQNSVFEPSINLAYSGSKRTQFDVSIPFVYRQSTYLSQGAQSSTDQTSARAVKSGAIGDMSAGVYYALHQNKLSDPTTILNAHFTIPTGTSPYGIKLAQDPSNNNLSYAISLPTGQGAYALSVGATMIKTLDPAVLFGGVSYNYNFVGHHPDISPYGSQIEPGSVQLGNAISFTMGTAFSLNDHVSTSFSFQDSIVAQSRVRPDGSRWSTIVGSALNAAVFNIGATFAVNPKVSYQTVLAIGVTKDAPNFQLTLRVPHNI